MLCHRIATYQKVWDHDEFHRLTTAILIIAIAEKCVTLVTILV